MTKSREKVYLQDAFVILKKNSVIFCNFPLDGRNKMVYNPFKKEHRYMYAVPTSLDGVRMAAQHTAMYFEKTYLSLGGKENENSM